MKLFDKKVIFGFFWPQKHFFSSAANSGQNKGVTAAPKENIEVPPTLPGESSGTHFSNFRPVTVLQGNPVDTIAEQIEVTDPSPDHHGEFCNMQNVWNIQKPWHSSPAWMMFFMVAIFALLLRAKRKEGINTATLDTAFYNGVHYSSWFQGKTHWRTWGPRYAQNHLESI